MAVGTEVRKVEITRNSCFYYSPPVAGVVPQLRDEDGSVNSVASV